jgi:thiol:disulfide interchange protein DsbC
MKKVVEKRKDIAFYIKLYPLPMHPGAVDKSKAIVCRKSLELLEQAFEGKQLPKPDCPAPEVEKNVVLAQSLGITGTPTMILPDGRIVSGSRPADELIKMIEEAGKKNSAN